MSRPVRTIRKHQRKSVLDDNKTLMDIAVKASRAAVQQAMDAGVAITFVEDGFLIKLEADKKRTSVKRVSNQPQLKLRELLCQN
ncbi:hypothetical protein [Rheinheimera aquimaris]|uniref:hypothetical protein n=1 Tax=Rheinheimera aquimaris TaxID=412437 RepID=UPI003A97BC32